jgi:hypothetical protein
MDTPQPVHSALTLTCCLASCLAWGLALHAWVRKAPGPQGDLAEPLVQLDAGLAGCEQEHAACLADRPDVAAARTAHAPAAPPQPCPDPGASSSASGMAGSRAAQGRPDPSAGSPAAHAGPERTAMMRAAAAPGGDPADPGTGSSGVGGPAACHARGACDEEAAFIARLDESLVHGAALLLL